MGIRFRKSIGNKYFRVNLSKSGIGYSAGVKGARVTKTAKGTTRTTVGIPGTGLDYVSETSNKKAVTANNQQQETKNGCLLTTLLGIVLTIVLLPIKLLIAAVKSIFKGNKDG